MCHLTPVEDCPICLFVVYLGAYFSERGLEQQSDEHILLYFFNLIYGDVRIQHL